MDCVDGELPRDWRDQSAAVVLEVAIIKHWHAWLTTVVTLPTVFISGVVLHPCHLVIRRRRDDAVLLDYKYRSLGAAADHYQYIAGRLSTESLGDFCFEYGIRVEEVA